MSNIKNKSGLSQYSGTTNSLGLVNATCFYGDLVGIATSATTTVNSETAVSATTALNATNAINATSATTALNATNAVSATTALNATSATTALNATNAVSAISATTAISASTAGANVGVGNGIYTGKTGTNLQFKSISGGSNIALIDDGTTITISGGSGGGGEVDTLYFDSNAKVVAVTDGACTCGDHDVDGALNILNGPAGNTTFGHAGTNNYISHSNTGSTFFRTHTGPTGTNYVTRSCMDCSGNHIFNDSVSTYYGTGKDMRVYHNGFTGYICNCTGSFYLVLANGETGLSSIANGGTCLYHNGSGKFATTSVGSCTLGVGCASTCFRTSYYCATTMYCATGAGTRICLGTGSGRAVSWTNTSDIRRKKCIKPYECGLDKVNQLKPVEYQWKHDDTEDIGFIAQDVLKVEPKLVVTSDKDEYGLNYSKFTALTVKAIQELSCEVKVLREEIEELKNK